MLTYCIKCAKSNKNLNPKIFKTRNNRLLMQSKCADCRNKKKSRFVKKTRSKSIIK